MKGLYFDNSTTTRPSPSTISGMLPYFTDRWGVPDAPHQWGQQLLAPIRKSLEKIYSMLGAPVKDAFVFTSSGAEAVCQVINGCYHDITLITGKNHYIVGRNDEATAMMAASRLESLNGMVTLAAVDSQGLVTADAVADALTPRTALLSLSWANGLLGVINPVEEIAAVCRERGVAFHLDATHILGKIFYHLEDIAPQFLTFNGDHLHAPKGSGGLLMSGTCSPLIVGGLEQAGGRAGNYSVANLVALGIAAQELEESRDYLCTEVARLRDRFEAAVTGHCPFAEVLFQEVARLPNVSVITFPGILNEALLYGLNQEGLYASIGGGGYQQLASQLLHCGFDQAVAAGSVSFSLSRETTEEEVEQAAHIVSEVAGRLRHLSAGLVEEE